jgi:hypothetical protein
MKKIIYMFTALLFAASVLFVMTACEPSIADEDPHDITPDEVYSEFSDIMSMPRTGDLYPNKINDYITRYMEDLGFTTETDTRGNLIAYIAATKGYKSEKPLIIECSTAGVENTVAAVQSGMGIAEALTIADHIIIAKKDGREHRAVRFLFIASDKEGASELNYVGANRLDGSLLVSLDGAGTESAALSSKYAALLENNIVLKPLKTKTKYAYVISASGYEGGDFGADAETPNPLDAIIGILSAVNSSGTLYDLCSIEGGASALSAPTEATAVIAVNDYEQKRVLQVFEDAVNTLAEKNSSIEITQTIVPKYTIAPDDASKIMTQLFSLEGSDFTEQYETLSGVFIGRVSLSPKQFICDASVMGTDAETVEKVADECGRIEFLSEIPTERIATLPAFITDKDNGSVKEFLEIYGSATGSDIDINSILGISPLGFVADKAPDIPIISIGATVKDADTLEESVRQKDIAGPANALLNYICPAESAKHK